MSGQALQGGMDESVMAAARRIARRVAGPGRSSGSWYDLRESMLASMKMDFPDLDEGLLRRAGEAALAENLHP